MEHAIVRQVTEDDTLDLGSLIDVVATVTVTDGDNDQVVDSTEAVSPLSLTISDTDPQLTVTGDPSFAALSVVEASDVGGSDTVTITAPTFDASAVDGFTSDVSYALALSGGTATGLQTTVGNHAITLNVVDANTITGVFFTATSTAMCHCDQCSACILDNFVGSLAFYMGDKTHPATVMFKSWIIHPLFFLIK